jgi:tRNA (cmo5U34)-methyltransferase
LSYDAWMSASASAFYDHLSRDYDALIRQLVPRYDELVETALSLVCGEQPRTVLEIGPGNGAAAAALLERLPSARITCVEDSPEMAARTERALSGFGSRSRVIRSDIRAYRPEVDQDVVLTSLVLHNVPTQERRALLRRIASWLRPGGLFVWAEFVRAQDPRRHEVVQEHRRRFALAAGCPVDVVGWNFRKEAEDDSPPTTREVLEGAGQLGFAEADLEWAHGAFAVFALRKPAEAGAEKA